MNDIYFTLLSKYIPPVKLRPILGHSFFSISFWKIEVGCQDTHIMNASSTNKMPNIYN